MTIPIRGEVWSRFVHPPDARGIGALRYPRLVPKDAASAKYPQKRTLTNLYNERATPGLAWRSCSLRRNLGVSSTGQSPGQEGGFAGYWVFGAWSFCACCEEVPR